MSRSRFDLIVSILENIEEGKKTTRFSLASQLKLHTYQAESLVELLYKRGFIESSGTFAEHEHNYLKLTYDGCEWLRKAKSLIVQLEG